MAAPDTIPNLHTWWRADSLALADNAAVASWADSGPNGFTLSQATSGSRPTYQTNEINGLPVVRFDGVNDALTSAAPGNLAAQTVIAVVKASATGGVRTYRGGQLQVVLDEGIPTAYSNSVGLIAQASGGSVGTAAFRVLTFAWSDTANTWAWYRDGAASGSGSSSTSASATRDQALGQADATGAREYFAGDVAELIGYSRVLTAAERASVHSYLQEKYGIAVTDYVPSATVVNLPVADLVADGLAPATVKTVGLPAAESLVEAVPVSVARAHPLVAGELVAEGLSATATVRNTDLAASDIGLDPLAVGWAYRVALPIGEQSVDPLAVSVAHAAAVPAADVAVEQAPVALVRVVHLPVGEVVAEPVPVGVARVIAVPAADQVVDGFILTLSSAVAIGDMIVEGLAVTVAYGAEVSASRRGLPPVIFLPSTRVIAQNIITGEFLHWELPVRDLEITWTLSGPTVITGSFEPEIQDLIGLDLQAHGTWLHVEDSGLIRASGILQPTRADDQKLTVEALGPSHYAAAIPYRGVYSQIGVDPAAVVKHLWQHIQGYPRGNLGVQVHGSTPVKLGTEPSEQVDFVTGGGEQVSFDRGGPYKLDWFTNRLIGAEIDELAGETPFDYVERAQWNAAKTDVEHHIDIAYPSIGRRRTDLRFADGENILESAPIEEPDGVYADEVIVQGSGEGQSAITGRAALPVPSRLRMPVVVVDKSITSKERANARAAEELSARLAAMIEVSEIAVNARHANAPLGSFSVGDEIQPHLVLPHIGAISPWSRVTGIRYLAESDAAVLALTRRGEFASR